MDGYWLFFSIDCCFTPYYGEMVPLLPAGMTGSNPGANDSDCRRGGLLNEPAYPPRKIRVCGRCGPAASSSWACVKQPTKPADKRVRPQGPARTHQPGTSSSHISPTPETFVATAAEIRSGAQPADPLDALPLLLGQVHFKGFDGAVDGLAVSIRGSTPVGHVALSLLASTLAGAGAPRTATRQASGTPAPLLPPAPSCPSCSVKLGRSEICARSWI